MTDVFETKIQPLLKELSELCIEQDIPFVATVCQGEKEDGYHLVTSACIPDATTPSILQVLVALSIGRQSGALISGEPFTGIEEEDSTIGLMARMRKILIHYDNLNPNEHNVVH